MHISHGDWMEQDFTQFAVLILCDYYTGCDEMGDYFAMEADTMIDIVFEVTRIKIGFEYLYLIGTFIKLSHLNVKLLFSICIFIYLSIIRIR